MAVLCIDGLAESMTQLVITPEDSDEDLDEMPTSVRSLLLSPSARLRLFMKDDRFMPAFNNRFEVAISEDAQSEMIEFIGLNRSVTRCLAAMEELKEAEGEFIVKKMMIGKEVHGRLTEMRNRKLMEIMESHDVYILHDAFPLSFPTEITVAAMDEERLEAAIVEIAKMDEDDTVEEKEKPVDVRNEEDAERKDQEAEEVLNDEGKDGEEQKGVDLKTVNNVETKEPEQDMHDDEVSKENKGENGEEMEKNEVKDEVKMTDEEANQVETGDEVKNEGKVAKEDKKKENGSWIDSISSVITSIPSIIFGKSTKANL